MEDSTESGMEESAYIGGAIAGLFYLVAGIRLTWLSLQTGEAPERLLAASFLLWGLSYIAWQIPIALANEWMLKWCFFAGRLLTDAGTVAFALFLRLVFRPQERWPTGLIGVVTVCMIAGIIGSAMVGDWEGVQPLGNPWWWLESAGFPITVVWMGIEGFHQNRWLGSACVSACANR